MLLDGDSMHAQEFSDLCHCRAIHNDKYNVDILKSLEKATYGRNNYFWLVENGLYTEPRYEGNYSGEDSYSDIDDVENSEDLKDSVGSCKDAANNRVDSYGQVLKDLFLK